MNMGASDVRRRLVARKRDFARRHFLTVGKAHPDMIFVAGTGRSGTTWLAEALTRGTRRRVVFEPFRNDRVPEWSGAVTFQYLRRADTTTSLLPQAASILRTSFRDEWADTLNGRFITTGRLVKDIRANLMLAWLVEQLGPFPLIHLIRNPLAVVHSWKRENWTATPVELYLSQPQLLSDHLAPFEDLIRSTIHPLERVALSWCIQNHVALRDLRPEERLVVFYEHLVADPEPQFRRIEAYTGVAIPHRASSSLATPSWSPTPGVRYDSQSDRLNSHSELTPS